MAGLTTYFFLGTYIRTDPESVLWASYKYPMDLDTLWISNKQCTGCPMD